MNPIIDKMLTVTAEIAEQLLAVKDSGADGLPAEAKIRIIELAEMASQMPDTEATCLEESMPEQEPEPQTEETVEEEEAPSTDETADEGVTYPDNEQPPTEEPALMSDEEFYFDSGSQEQPQHDAIQDSAGEEPLTDAPPHHEADLTLWRSIFSINDMYLFRRELFNGSETLMSDALATIGSAGNLEQVRTILADRYGIDLRTRVAKDFISTISTLF